MDSHLDLAESLLDTAIARIRTGWRVRWLPKMVDGKIDNLGDGVYVVFGPHGNQGVSENPRHAANYYLWRCAHGPQTEQVPTWHDFLPGEQEQADVLDDHLRLVHWSEM